MRLDKYSPVRKPNPLNAMRAFGVEANLSMFMVNVSAKLIDTLRCKRGLKYLHETLKILPQKPEPIVIQQIAQHLGAIGAIHHTQPELNPG
ncbi:hypothetical protein J4G08_06850 [Candidatus Poribacteria bacterium]|nr:hypothetical protein [Candidatus Poribacteria bacterium]